jgi:hypothetical protein
MNDTKKNPTLSVKSITAAKETNLGNELQVHRAVARQRHNALVECPTKPPRPVCQATVDLRNAVELSQPQKRQKLDGYL